MRWLALTLALGAISTGCAARGRQPDFHSLVPLCSILARPGEYEGKIVRTTGLLTSGPEVTFLWSEECRAPEKRVWIDALGSPWNIDRRNRRRLSRLTRAGQARVVVEGRFLGPKSVIPPGVNASMDELYRQTHSRWGHGNGFHYTLQAPTFYSVEAVASTH